jgi:hypothetical protein
MLGSRWAPSAPRPGCRWINVCPRAFDKGGAMIRAMVSAAARVETAWTRRDRRLRLVAVGDSKAARKRALQADDQSFPRRTPEDVCEAIVRANAAGSQ